MDKQRQRRHWLDAMTRDVSPKRLHKIISGKILLLLDVEIMAFGAIFFSTYLLSGFVLGTKNTVSKSEE